MVQTVLTKSGGTTVLTLTNEELAVFGSVSRDFSDIGGKGSAGLSGAYDFGSSAQVIDDLTSTHTTYFANYAMPI